MEDQWLLWQRDDEIVAVLLDERSRRRDGAPHDFGELNLRLAECKFSATDPVHVEQVVDQADHLLDLRLHRLERLADSLRIAPAQPQHLHAHPDWGEGDSELVRQSGEEVVLLPVGLLPSATPQPPFAW